MASDPLDGYQFSEGFVFMCSSLTEQECFKRSLFGQTTFKWHLVQNIQPDTALFLLNFSDPKIMHGVFVPDGEPQKPIMKNAWNGRYPAQIRFKRIAHMTTRAPRICSRMYGEFLTQEEVWDIIGEMRKPKLGNKIKVGFSEKKKGRKIQLKSVSSFRGWGSVSSPSASQSPHVKKSVSGSMASIASGTWSPHPASSPVVMTPPPRERPPASSPPVAFPSLPHRSAPATSPSSPNFEPTTPPSKSPRNTSEIVDPQLNPHSTLDIMDRKPKYPLWERFCEGDKDLDEGKLCRSKLLKHLDEVSEQLKKKNATKELQKQLKLLQEEFWKFHHWILSCRIKETLGAGDLSDTDSASMLSTEI